ncbi:tRNA modification GTPase MnmE [Spirochaetia bacterium]|nr:tRNA modification GTPase MnmE [Spirochaetia bacterium]
MRYGDDAPIAARATPLAESALSLVRVSGKKSIELVSRIFSRPKKLLAAGGNTILHGWIVEKDTPDKKIDEVLVCVYREPESYTGEDGLDICCHGGIAVSRDVLAALFSVGFREALRGEFTFRAFINGKLDLTRAESVMEIVSAKSGEARGRAVKRLSGVLENEIKNINKLILGVLAETELLLDYSEIDGIGDENSRLPGGDDLAQAKKRLSALRETYRAEKLYRDGALVVFAGCPNAGKSSLFNLLLKEERSIVTEVPGTTRDYIEAWITIKDIPICLADTAGLCDSNDTVEKIGVMRSKNLLETADLVLYVIDGEAGLCGQDSNFFINNKSPGQPFIVIWNKCDIAGCTIKDSAMLGLDSVISVSAKTGEGIIELMDNIADCLTKNLTVTETAAALGSERQKQLVDNALKSLESVYAMENENQPLDLIAPVLREAVNSLGEITGEVSTQNILETMFSKFCVGK